MNLGGSLTRQIEQDATVGDASPHLVNIGKMVEVGIVLLDGYESSKGFRQPTNPLGYLLLPWLDLCK